MHVLYILGSYYALFIFRQQLVTQELELLPGNLFYALCHYWIRDIWSILTPLAAEPLIQTVPFSSKQWGKQKRTSGYNIFCIFNAYYYKLALCLHTHNEKYWDPWQFRSLTNTLWQPKRLSRHEGKSNWQYKIQYKAHPLVVTVKWQRFCIKTRLGAF